MDSCVNQILAENVRRLRTELGLSQLEVAKKADLSFRSYQQIEAATGNPTLFTIERLAETFATCIDNLLRLSCVRTNQTPEEFLKNFTEAFNKLNFAVFVRDHNGIILERNSSANLLYPFSKSDQNSVLINGFYQDGSDSQSIVKHHLGLEKIGVVRGYSTCYICSEHHERKMLHINPVLILPAKGRSPLFTVVSVLTAELDNCTNRAKFYQTVIDFCMMNHDEVISDPSKQD